MSMITTPRVGGLALILGAAFYIVATLITPGHLIGETTAGDLGSMVDAIADNPLLTAFAAMLGAVALMFLIWGLTVMWQTAQNECALDAFVKFGLVGVMLALVSFLIAQCLNYTTSHVVDHGIGVGTGPDQTEALRSIAIQMQSIGGAARLLGALSGLTGYVVLGFAFARKFKPGVYRILARIVGIAAIVSLIGVVLTEPFHELIDALAPIFTVLSILYLVWWIIIGVGVYQERFGLRIGTTPEH